MRTIVTAVLYIAALASAIPAMADISAAAALRDGDMRKLTFHDAPQAVSNAAFALADDAGEGRLEDWRGKWVLLNFWATWCAPCRHEMPMLAALQSEFGGERFEVLTIATGRNSPRGIAKFFEEVGIDNLPRHQDPDQSLASQMGIFGLPITVIIDPDGREIARLRGDADWSSASAKAIIATLVGQGG